MDFIKCARESRITLHKILLMCHYNKNVIQQTARSNFFNNDQLTLHTISQFYYMECNLPAILIDTLVIISKPCSVSGFWNFQCLKSSHKHNQIMQWILARYFLKKKISSRKYQGTCWSLCSISIWHCHWKIQSSIAPLWRPKQTH